jgi:hypothetical protein
MQTFLNIYGIFIGWLLINIIITTKLDQITKYNDQIITNKLLILFLLSGLIIFIFYKKRIKENRKCLYYHTVIQRYEWLFKLNVYEVNSDIYQEYITAKRYIKLRKLKNNL